MVEYTRGPKPKIGETQEEYKQRMKTHLTILQDAIEKNKEKIRGLRASIYLLESQNEDIGKEIEYTKDIS